MTRSLKLHKDHDNQVENSLTRNRITREYLVETLEISRSTIDNFFRYKAISRDNFYEICRELNLDPLEISRPIQKAIGNEISNSNNSKVVKTSSKIVSATLSGISFLKQSDLSYLLFGEPTNLDNYLSFNSSHSSYNDRYLQMEAAIHFKDKLKECDFEIGKNYFKSSYLEFGKHNIFMQDWETSKKVGIDFERGIDTLYLTALIPITNCEKEEVKIVQVTSKPKTWTPNIKFPRLVNEDFRLTERTEKIRFRCNLDIDFPEDGIILPPGKTDYVSIMASITTDIDNEPLFPFEKAYIKLLALPELWNYSQKGINDLKIKIDRNQGKVDELCFDLAVTNIIDVHEDKIELSKSDIFLQENVTEEFIANFSKVEAFGRSKLGEYIDYLRELEGDEKVKKIRFSKIQREGEKIVRFEVE